MPMTAQTIRLHRDAPTKPALAAPCNGCGVCCAAEPCPALEWHDDRYRCGLLARPRHYLPWLPARWNDLARRLLGRWLAAGKGCDSAVFVARELSN